MRIIAFVFLFPFVLFAQKNDTVLNYIYHFPGRQDSLLLIGYKVSESPQYITATEFFVINCNTNDTITFFDALQNCLIDKIYQNTLSVIETKYLPFRYPPEWETRGYLRYSFVVNVDRKVVIDSILLFNPWVFTIEDENKIVKDYEEIKSGTKSISEELSYFVMYMALNNETWAKEKLFDMKEELKLDGSLAEINSDAINIYNTYHSLRK